MRLRRHTDVAQIASGLAISILLAACGNSSPDSAATSPEQPVSAPVSSGPQKPNSRTELRRPEPGLVDVHPRPFDNAAGEGRKIVLTYYSGLDECVGLDRIDVNEKADRVTITIFEGRHPEAEVCAEIAVLVRSVVELARPLGDREVIDGAK